MVKISNNNKIQAFQNILLRQLFNAPPYISNLTLHNDLHIKTTEKEVYIFCILFHKRLQTHSNPLIKDLFIFTQRGNPDRRLKRKWCCDFCKTLKSNKKINK